MSIGSLGRRQKRGKVKQLSVGLSKVIILVENHSDTILVSWKDKDVGNGSGGVEDLVLKCG